MALENINKDNFQEVVKKGNVLVDFWAPWCGPCKMIAPILEGIASQRTDVNIVKLNVDENKEVAAKYGIRGIPTMILFKDGVPMATKIGAVNKDSLVSWLDMNV